MQASNGKALTKADNFTPANGQTNKKGLYALLDAEREHLIAALRHFGEVEDARAALRLAVQLFWLWLLSGSQQEAKTWTEFALAVPGEADPADRMIAGRVP